MRTEDDETRWIDGVDLAEKICGLMSEVSISLLMVSSCVGAMHFPKMVKSAEGLVEDAKALLEQARILAAPPKTIYGMRVVGEEETPEEKEASDGNS